MYRVGGKNPHTVYWSDDDPASTVPDRYVATAMTPQAAVRVVIALANLAADCGEEAMPPWVTGLPEVPRREAAP